MPESICWIDDVDYQDADPALRTIYDRVKSPHGGLDNLYRGFSLSPQTILPADDLYLAAMHHRNNVLPKVFAELIGTCVAQLAKCEYAQAHHGQNFIALSDDAGRASEVLQWLKSGDYGRCGNDREVAALRYTRKLCLEPGAIEQADVESLRQAGWSDTEISEIVQVIGMFSYFVRVINGLGITLGDEKLGLY